MLTLESGLEESASQLVAWPGEEALLWVIPPGPTEAPGPPSTLKPTVTGGGPALASIWVWKPCTAELTVSASSRFGSHSAPKL